MKRPEGVSFGAAVELMNAGYAVAREAWGTGLGYLAIPYFSETAPSPISFICEGHQSLWSPTHVDVTAWDWRVVVPRKGFIQREGESSEQSPQEVLQAHGLTRPNPDHGDWGLPAKSRVAKVSDELQFKGKPDAR